MLAAAAAVSGCGGDDDDARATPNDFPAAPAVTISQNGKLESVRIEVAATGPQRQQGLMFRTQMAEDAGMLFLFPRDVQIGFWMRNTNIPLDIAYVAADGKVLEIRAAKPLDETVLTPATAYRYVIELNQGWFERHGMGVGAMVTLPTGLPAATE